MSGRTRMRKSWSILHTFILLFFFLHHHHTGCNARMWRMMAEMEEVAEVVHSSLLHRRQLQSALYCVAIASADPTQLQTALDWACGAGQGNVDCSSLQVGGACYNPNTLVDHASYAFNLYYIAQSAANGSCNFNGLATPTPNKPSSSSTCNYPVYGGSTTPSPTTPVTPTPPTTTTPSGSNTTTTTFPPPTSGTTFDNTTTGTTSSSTPSPIVGPPWLHALCGGILLILFLKL